MIDSINALKESDGELQTKDVQRPLISYYREVGDLNCV